MEKPDQLFKEEVDPKVPVEAFFQRLDVDKFFSFLNNNWHPAHILQKIGGADKIELLLKDTDIYGSIDKRIAALMDTSLILQGTSQALVDQFTEMLKPFEIQLKKDFFWTTWQGYGVEQIIYNPNGEKEVVGFQREQFYRFEPMPDLLHVKLIQTSNNEWRNKILPWGKWILTTNDGTYFNPQGNMLAEKLIQPWIFKCNGWDLWMDFAKRFANGFMHAKIEDIDMGDDVRARLEAAGKSAVLVTDTQTEINMVQPSRDSSIYLSITEQTIKSINKAILGETLTSDVGDVGSRAAAQVHNEVRLEKTRADILIVEDGINQAIDQIAAVFGIKGELPRAKLVQNLGLNYDLAERDGVLHSQGVNFTKKYYQDKYGLKEDEFEVVDTTAQNQSFFGQKKRTFLKPNDVAEFLGVKDYKRCGHKTSLAESDAALNRKANKSNKQKEDIVQLLKRRKENPISSEDLIAAISISKTEEELDQNLAALFDQRDVNFSEDLTKALYSAATGGALLGNPKRLTKDEIEE